MKEKFLQLLAAQYRHYAHQAVLQGTYYTSIQLAMIRIPFFVLLICLSLNSGKVDNILLFTFSKSLIMHNQNRIRSYLLRRPSLYQLSWYHFPCSRSIAPPGSIRFQTSAYPMQLTQCFKWELWKLTTWTWINVSQPSNRSLLWKNSRIQRHPHQYQRRTILKMTSESFSLDYALTLEATESLLFQYCVFMTAKDLSHITQLFLK